MFIPDVIAQSRLFRCSRMASLVIVGMAIVPFTAIAEDTFEYVGFDPASYSPEGLDGMKEIFSGRMFNSAAPLSFLEAMAAEDAARKDELGYDPSSVEGKFYGTGMLPSPPNRDVDANVALGQSVFERDGALLSNGNCFACHAGAVNGNVVAGLGNNAIMQSPPRPEGTPTPNMFKLAAALKNDAEKKVMSDMMKRRKGVSPVIPETTNRGDNFGPFAVWARGAQLSDPAKKGLVAGDEQSDLVALIEDNMVPPVDPMPWWLMKYKVRDYWYGDGNPSDAAHFSFNFTSTQPGANEHHASHVASTAKALAFARETQSPIFPDSLDAALVEQGADIFHGRTAPEDATAFKACFECHGTYTKNPSQPDLSIPGAWTVAYDGSEELKKVRTDPEYNDVVQKLRPISKHINELATYLTAELAPVYNHLEGKGYVPPPLVGVWATAPYFHNGSVPTITAVLNSSERPEIWAREQSPFVYNLEEIGLMYDEVTRKDYEACAEKSAAAPYKSKTSLDQMFIYDTTGFGRGNMGHTFGDSLTTNERTAIIEFLKSLSGPDMDAADSTTTLAKR